MQSRKSSIIEQCFNVGSGFVIAMLLRSFVIGPVWDIEKPVAQDLQIILVFTAVSLIRGYVWRRVFNKKEVKDVRA